MRLIAIVCAIEVFCFDFQTYVVVMLFDVFIEEFNASDTLVCELDWCCDGCWPWVLESCVLLVEKEAFGAELRLGNLTGLSKNARDRR